MVAWTANATLPSTLMAVAREVDMPFRKRMQLRFALLFATDEQVHELEFSLTQAARMAGAIPPTGQIVDGVYVGSWQDLFQWFLDNWPKILEMILAIISLF